MLPATPQPHSCHKPVQGPTAEAAISAHSERKPSIRLSRSTQVFLGRHRTQVHGYRPKAPIFEAAVVVQTNHWQGSRSPQGSLPRWRAQERAPVPIALQYKLASSVVASVCLCSKLELHRDSMMISEAI